MTVQELADLFVKLAKDHPDSPVMIFEDEFSSLFEVVAAEVHLTQAYAYRRGPLTECCYTPFKPLPRLATPHEDKMVVALGLRL